MKTSKEHFELFKQATFSWCKFLGISDWELYFKHENLEKDFSNVALNYRGKVATFTLSTEWPEDLEMLTEAAMERTARHEVIHLFLAPLWCLACDRFASQAEIDTAEETLVRRLEKITSTPFGID